MCNVCNQDSKVSIPFFVILYGFLYVNREEEYVVDAPADAIDQAPPPI